MNSRTRFVLLIGVVVFAFNACGCVQNRRFQASIQPTPPALNVSRAKPTAVVELDDMGQLWDRCALNSTDAGACQLKNAVQYIEDERRAAARAGEDSVVITFVHGWRHNAESRDENLASFTTMLFTLQDNVNQAYDRCTKENVQLQTHACPVRRTRFIGAYVGWRGQVVRTPLDFFTVFDREAAAQRTALVSMSETLVRLRNAAKQTSLDDPTLPADSARFLLFGHSFGGLIVERAMAQMFTASLLPEHKKDTIPCANGGDGVRPFADLVVLINPAADSVETVQLIDLMKRSKVRVCAPIKMADGVSAPLIVSIHSRTDAATGKVFAVGHTLESINKSFRPKERCEFCDSGVGRSPTEGFLYRHTAGHAIYLANFCYIDQGNTGDWVCESLRHLVDEAKSHVGGDSTKSTFDMAQENHSLKAPLEQQLHGLLAIPGLSGSSLEPTPILNLYYRALPEANPDRNGHTKPWNDTPYWVFTVPDHIVQKHGGFWNSDFTGLMSSLVVATTPPNGTEISLH